MAIRNPTYKFTINILGDSQVGKKEFVKCCYDMFDQGFLSFKTSKGRILYTLVINSKEKCDANIIMYDLTRSETFDNIDNYIILENVRNNTNIIVGNKSDLIVNNNNDRYNNNVTDSNDTNDRYDDNDSSNDPIKISSFKSDNITSLFLFISQKLLKSPDLEIYALSSIRKNTVVERETIISIPKSLVCKLIEVLKTTNMELSLELEDYF